MVDAGDRGAAADWLRDCWPIVDVHEPGPAAAQRLEGILAKLAALTPNENLTRAIAHYRGWLEEFRRADRTALIGGVTMFAILGAAIVAAIAWLVSRLV